METDDVVEDGAPLHRRCLLMPCTIILNLFAEVKGPVGQILYTDKAILAVEQNKVLMPPTYNKYVAWGFADHSLRIGNYDNDKAVFVCEAVAQACGEIVACVCLSDKTIVTAGTSTVSRRSQRIVDIIPKAQFTPRGNGMEASISTHRHKTFICSCLFYLVHKVNSLLNLCRVN